MEALAEALMDRALRPLQARMTAPEMAAAGG